MNRASFPPGWVIAILLTLTGYLFWKDVNNRRLITTLETQIATNREKIADLTRRKAAANAQIVAADEVSALALKTKEEADKKIQREIVAMEQQISASQPSVKFELGTGERKTSGAFKNQGFGSPKSAIETLFWALNNGEPTIIASGLILNPSLKEKSKQFFDKLSDDHKKLYGSPEGLIGFLLAAGTPVDGMTVMDTTTSKNDRLATLRLNIDFIDGAQVQPEIKMLRSNSDWQWILPDELARKFAKILTGEFPMPSSKPVK